MKLIRAVTASTLAGAMILASASTAVAEIPIEQVTNASHQNKELELLSEAKVEAAERLTTKKKEEVYAYLAVVAEAQRLEAERVARERREAERETARKVEVEVREVAPPPSPGGVWAALAECESGMSNANTGNGYYGYFQFSATTWRSVGGSGLPTDHDYETQLHYAQVLQARSGWGQWPACSGELGLR